MPPLRQGGGNKKPIDAIKQTRKEDAKDVYKAKGESGKRTKTKLEKEADKYRQAGKDFKGVGYIPPKVKGGTSGGSGKGKTPGPKEVTPIAPETVVPSSGVVDGVNYKELYLEEVKRLVLSLVKSAKSLLIRYNFSGIDRVAEYYLDADREAKSEAVASSTSRPESPFTLEQASLQDRFSLDLNEINNKISDLTNSSEKSIYFGSMRGGTFLPREVKVLRDGRTGYDMRLTFTSISNQDFIIKCYEVS